MSVKSDLFLKLYTFRYPFPDYTYKYSSRRCNERIWCLRSLSETPRASYSEHFPSPLYDHQFRKEGILHMDSNSMHMNTKNGHPKVTATIMETAQPALVSIHIPFYRRRQGEVEAYAFSSLLYL